MHWTSRINTDAGHGVSEDKVSANDTECEDTEMNASKFRTNADAFLQLDDEALFGIIKKLACNGLRQILSGSVGPCADTSSIPFVCPVVATCRGIHGHVDVKTAKKTITGVGVSVFSDVIGKLSPEKKLVIKAYGFESLLSFDKCVIPLPFAHWLADHVEVTNSNIAVRGTCIPLNPQIVHDVLGIPIGGTTITTAKSDSAKHGFLSVMGLNSLPSASTCVDNLFKDGISDDDFVRNFLIVAMVTFLCPNLNNYPSTKYLEPLIGVKVAKEWDWCTFVHYWLLNQIKKYNILKKKGAHASVTLGGCLYLLCVVYLDFVDFGQELLPSIFPRIKVWRGDMIKEYSDFNCVKGHFYGKHPILQFKCTCYGKRNSIRTPSASCNIDGSSFKRTLAESVCASLSARTLDDVTALYLKHATSPNELVHVHVQSAIVDVVNYFCHRAQTDKIPRTQDMYDFVAPKNVKESEAAATVVKSHTTDSEGRIVAVDGHVHTKYSQGVHVSGTGVGDDIAGNDKIAAGNNAVDVANDNAPGYVNGCHAHVGTTKVVVVSEKVSVVSENLHGGNTIDPVVGNQKDTPSSDTLILPSCGGYSSSTKASIADTEIILSSPTLSDSVQLSLGGSLLKRKRVSTPITSLNSEHVGSTIAGRTRSHRLSSSPVADANEPAAMDNPEAILRKNSKKRIATEMRERGQNLKTACNAIDVGDNSETLANKSASFNYMVREDKSRDLEPTYVDDCPRGPSFDVGSLHTSKNPQVGLGLPISTISAAEKVNACDFPVPTFNLLDEDDSSTYVAPHNENLNRSNICDGNMNAQNKEKGPVFDETPPAVPLSAHDTAGRLFVISSQESPPDVHVTGHRSCVNDSEVVITGERQFIVTQNRLAQEAEKIYDANDGSCFSKCQMIAFNLGSSSKGGIGKSRRPRRIIQPNSYFRNFQVNVCNARYSVTLPERMVYDCVLFYSQYPERARDDVINYDNVRVTFEDFGSSMRRCDKKSVHNHVVNAFCRKLFKDKHPRASRRHYFFSPVGDYLMNHDHEGNKNYLHDNCERCFKLANGSLDFKSSDFLFFPICHDTHWFVFVVALRDGYFVFLDSFFDEDSLYQKEVRAILIPNFLKAWDEFIHCDWNFHEFVVHYAAVPQQDRKFFSKFDDGIFVLKYLELWDPCLNMMVQFSSSNIREFRMLLVNSMIFSKHNLCNDAKDLVSDHKAMLALMSTMRNLPSSMF